MFWNEKANEIFYRYIIKSGIPKMDQFSTQSSPSSMNFSHYHINFLITPQQECFVILSARNALLFDHVMSPKCSSSQCILVISKRPLDVQRHGNQRSKVSEIEGMLTSQSLNGVKNCSSHIRSFATMMKTNIFA